WWASRSLAALPFRERIQDLLRRAQPDGNPIVPLLRHSPALPELRVRGPDLLVECRLLVLRSRSLPKPHVIRTSPPRAPLPARIREARCCDGRCPGGARVSPRPAGRSVTAVERRVQRRWRQGARGRR